MGKRETRFSHAVAFIVAAVFVFLPLAETLAQVPKKPAMSTNIIPMGGGMKHAGDACPHHGEKYQDMNSRCHLKRTEYYLTKCTPVKGGNDMQFEQSREFVPPQMKELLIVENEITRESSFLIAECHIDSPDPRPPQI